MTHEGNAPFTKQQAQTEANRCLHCFEANCKKSCPANIDVAKFVRRIATEDYTGAAETILAENPLGGICAMVCPSEQLCQKNCASKLLGKEIQIAKLQNFALRKVRPSPALPPASGKTVAVVGGGPSGLTAAVCLAQRGHKVTLFEQEESLGGVPSMQIPAYRLPGIELQQDLEGVTALGVEMKLKAHIDEAAAAGILNQYDAVYLAVGLTEKITSQVMEGPCRMYAEDFLRLSKLGKITAAELGEDVVVMGGGNTAMDAASVAKMLGVPRVRVVYRRTAEEMPAWKREYLQAVSLGVEFCWRTLMISAKEENGRLIGLSCAPARPQGKDAKGRDKMEADTAQLVEMKASFLLSAFGSRGGEALAKAFGLLADGAGPANANVGKVFAGGDFINGGDTVVQAVADGKRAAEKIHAYIV